MNLDHLLSTANASKYKRYVQMKNEKAEADKSGACSSLRVSKVALGLRAFWGTSIHYLCNVALSYLAERLNYL